MTRKDYVAIAVAIHKRVEMARNIQNTASRMAHYKELADDLAEMMSCGNPRFDRARFLKACGVQS